jgi:hypothetical protein
MLIFLSLFGNPVEAARIAGLIAAGDVAIFGAAGAALHKFLGGLSETILVCTLLAWTAIPIALASRVLRRGDL